LAEHLAACGACRDVRDLVRSLEQAGTETLLPDVSPQSARETRRQTARLIAPRNEPHREQVILTFPRLAFAAALPLVLLAAGVLMVVRGLQDGTPAVLAGKEASSVPAELTIDERIEALHRRVDLGLVQFRATYQARRHGSRLELAANRLRRNIELCSYQLTEELGMGNAGDDSGNAPEPMHRDMNEGKEETRHEQNRPYQERSRCLLVYPGDPVGGRGPGRGTPA